MLRQIVIPPSKSHTMRALIFALMAKGRSTVLRPLDSPDTEAMIGAISALGARVTRGGDTLVVQGTGGILLTPSAPIDAGNSGQVLRFIGALSALQEGEVVITGDHSICTRRPVVPLLEGLNQLGATARSVKGNGCAPIAVKGVLNPGEAMISGEDSQPVSALLMASAFLPGTTKIAVNNPGEKPWVALTLSWLKRFGVEVANDDFAKYSVQGMPSLEAFEMSVPGDFSAAAYLLAFGLLSHTEIELLGLDMTDVQGDKQLVHTLIQMGACIEIGKSCLRVKKGSRLVGREIDVNEMIDALPILAVVGCFATGTTTLKGGAIARCKESDRIAAIVQELKKMGADIEEREDGLVVSQSALKGATLSSHADHRIALSLWVASLLAKGKSDIEGSSCIAKSYPTFWSHLKQVGAVE